MENRREHTDGNSLVGVIWTEEWQSFDVLNEENS